MIYHIPAGTTIHRMKAASKDPKYTEAIVTDKEVYYVDKDLVKLVHRPVGATSGIQAEYIFLLPLSAKPWWSFRVYKGEVHRIEFIGMNTKGPKSEKELLRDLKSGKIDPFKTTPEYKANNGTAEERIVGRTLTPRERAEIKEQWNNEDDNFCRDLMFPVAIKHKKLKTVQTAGFMPPPINPLRGWAKDVWLRPLLRPILPILPKSLLPNPPKPDDPAEAIAWAIDQEIMKEMVNGMWVLGDICPSAKIFYLDYKFGDKK